MTLFFVHSIFVPKLFVHEEKKIRIINVYTIIILIIVSVAQLEEIEIGNYLNLDIL